MSRRHNCQQAVKGMKNIVSLLILFAITGSLALGNSSCFISETMPLRIGVLLPLTGARSIHSVEVLDWFKNNVNESGGINNREIELTYKDTSIGDISELAQELVDDASVRIVIGPCHSDEVYEIAPLFIQSKKVLISPTSTAGDVFRAFGGEKFFWRTCQSDVAQVRTIVYVLSSRDVKKISFIYEEGDYAKTFSDWIGFFSMEIGIELLNMVKYEGRDRDFSRVINKALRGDPEYIVCTVSSVDAVEIKKELDQTHSSARLFFTDSASTPYLINALGNAAEGLEGTVPAADPTSGFDIAFRTEFGHAADSFAATTYDAFLLAVYALARQQYKPDEGIEESLEQVIKGQGIPVGWNKEEMKVAIERILQGELPDLSGASGPLEFDGELGVDPLETFYCHWRVEAGDFGIVEVIGSGQSSDIGVVKEGSSAYRTLASKRLGELRQEGAISHIPADKRDLWAVIIATSMGWKNYRHQADALAVYDLLKSNGVNDDKIILMLVDDIPNNERNEVQGDVHHSVRGKNLRDSANIDYSGRAVSIENFRNVLLGNKTFENSDVLGSNEYSNVLIYIVGHGSQGLISFEYDGILEAAGFVSLINDMYQKERYRRMFIMVETCYGESMALNLETPGVVCFTGGSVNEPTFACNYDRNMDAWLADDFTYQVLGTILQNRDLSILELYATVYARVAGSHVRLKNYGNFGNIAGTSFLEFISP
ncbi:C13 family peptidase [Chloroflexota bacterium]